MCLEYNNAKKDHYMDSQGTSKTKIIAGAVVAIVVLVIIAGAVYALVSSNQQQTVQPSNQGQNQPKPETVSQQSLQQDFTDLDAAIKKSQGYHADAKAAVEDQAKRIKVGQ